MLICFRIVNIECVVFYIQVFFFLSFFLVSSLRRNLITAAVQQCVEIVFFFLFFKIKPRGNLTRIPLTASCRYDGGDGES